MKEFSYQFIVIFQIWYMQNWTNNYLADRIKPSFCDQRIEIREDGSGGDSDSRWTSFALDDVPVAELPKSRTLQQ